MRDKPRKNLRGLMSHVKSIVRRLIREEFPDLGSVWVTPAIFGQDESCLAQWHEITMHDGKVGKYVMLNTYKARGRLFYLKTDDEELRDIVRHELLHGEMHRRGQPWEDNDASFIMECLRRRIKVNDASIPIIEATYGRGSFGVFQTFLPPAETVTILLPENSGVWLRKTGR